MTKSTQLTPRQSKAVDRFHDALVALPRCLKVGIDGKRLIFRDSEGRLAAEIPSEKLL